MIRKGFTLVELLVSIAIITVLAAVVLVSMSFYGKSARSTKALAQLSSVIPSMVSCWGNGGTVNDYDTDPAGCISTPVVNPASGQNICSLGSAYGVWPQSCAGDLSNYYYSNFAIYPTTKTFQVGLYSAVDALKICCNSKMKNCKIISPATPSTANCPGSTTCTTLCPEY